MITIKLPILKIDITDYLNQYNNIVRFAYNRFQEGLIASEIERSVKSTMNNIDLMDASLIKSAVDNARCLKKEKIIFGGKKNWKRYNQGLISKEEYQEKKLKPLTVRGSKLDHNGNRKFQLDLDNNRVVFKPKRGVEFIAKFPSTKRDSMLKKLQQLCELGETCFTCGITNNHIYITFDETIFCDGKYRPIKKRVMAVDLNSNYVALVVRDKDKIIHKEIIGLLKLNKSKTNKKRHEDYEICKRITETARHFRVAHFINEKLDIKSSDKKKGKRFNKMCNNDWRRRRMVTNIHKRCNIIGIHVQEVIAQYSSFIGQIDNDKEYDSIAAAIEISRRGILFLRKYYYNENIDVTGKIIRIKEEINTQLADRWKKKLNVDFIFTYKNLYDQIKKLKYSYRSLFQFDWFSTRMKSKKSLVYVY